MSKQRTSVSIDEEVAVYLKQDGVNASGLVNRLVKAEMDGAGGDMQLIKLRLEQVESQLESLESQVDQKREEKRRLQRRLEEHKTETQEKIADAAEQLGEHMLEPDNLAVQRWADDLDMTPESN